MKLKLLIGIILIGGATIANAQTYKADVPENITTLNHYESKYVGEIYFGPKAPKGHEANWAPTKAGVDYFLLFRFYGPTEALSQKTWVLGDLVKQ